MAHRVVLCALVSFLLAAGCYVGVGTNTNNSDGGTASVTFHKDVEPILQQHCQSCHVSGGIAPFPLLTYDDAKTNADDIVKQTGSLVMPPWGARNVPDSCTTRSAFKNDPSLTPDQITLLANWVAQGAVEGNIADAPPPFTPAPPGLDGANVDVSPAQGYTLQADATEDEFVCFVLDPKITTTSYINGSAVLPGNSLIVHHAVIYADPNRQSLGLITNQDQQSYPCFGGSNVTNGSLVAAWAPGGGPHEFPSNVGMPITAGSLLVMQVHYHPHTTDPKNQDVDVTHLQLRTTTAAPQYYAVSKIIGNFTSAPELQDAPFDIPPDASGHTETMKMTIPQSMTKGKPTALFSIGGHMHLVGSDIKVSLDRASPTGQNPSSECLMEIPKWDFYWQRQYEYDLDISQLPSVSAGDTLTIRCTYDNTMDNPALVSELTAQGQTQPVDVKLGESTLDEMCLAIVTTVVPAN